MRKRAISIILIIALAFPFVPGMFNTAKAEDTSYAPKVPASLPQPAKGQSVYDPQFGNTRIIRLTDRSDGPNGCVVPYSYWPIFNCNSTKYWIADPTNGQLRLYNFDPDTYTSTYVGPLNTGLDWQGLIWSYDDPNILYGLRGYYAGGNNQLCAYNVATGQLTVIHDFTASGDLPKGNPLQLSKARENDRYFSFHWKANDNSAPRYAVVYDRQLNRTYLFDASDPNNQVSYLDECRLDRDGTKLVIVTGAEFHIWDYVNDTQEIVYANFTDHAGGHYNVGNGWMANMDIYSTGNGNRTLKRWLSSPKQWIELFDSGRFANPPYSVIEWNVDHHYSIEGPNDDWMCISSRCLAGADYTKPFQNEIWLVKTDGSGQVKRLAHHRSSMADYWRSPFAQISPDGRFIAFNSDWNNPNQPQDIYIIPLDDSIWGGSSPTPTPTPTPSPGGVFNDNETGTGNNQIEYVGNWIYRTDFTSGPYQLDLHEHKNRNATDYALIRFYGTGIKIYSLLDSWNGICAISVDGGTETLVDTYSSTLQWQSLIYTRTGLPEGNHTVKIKMTNTKNPNSYDYCIFIDKFEVIASTSSPSPTPTPTPTPMPIIVNNNTTGTGNNQFEYGPTQWSWSYDNSSWCSGAYQSDLHGSQQTDAYARIRFNGTQIKLYGVKGSWFGKMGVKIDSGAETIIDCYENTQEQMQVLLYTSPVLPPGQHTLTIRSTGTKNPNSYGMWVYVDKVEIQP